MAGGENIEMDPMDPETRTTSTCREDSRLPPPIPSRNSEFDGDPSFNYESPLNSYSKSDRKIYFADETTKQLGEAILTDYYPDAGDNRPEHLGIEIGLIKTGTATGRIGVRLFGKDVEFTPI